MENREFVERVANMYRDARVPIFPHPSIVRGRSHSIASKVEDLFARFVVDTLGDDAEGVTIFVDQPIRPTCTNKTFYPDVALARGDRLVQMWDLKTDLGYDRGGFAQKCREKADLLGEIRGNVGFLSNRQINFSENLMYNVVVVSKRNIQQNLVEQHIDEIRVIDGVDAFFLTDDVHPNFNHWPVAEIMGAINILDEEFDRVRQRVREAVTQR
ncbi:MAG: hypothetical protein IPM59_14040 [Chloracidobacterium sp.]|nr:hypothetical protein [Chloracidobacterium sp.]